MSRTPADSLRIMTPEGVVFSYRLASPVARGLAWTVDALAIGAASYTLSQLSQLAGFLSADFANFLGAVLYFVISTGYGIVLEWRWQGQTLGKRLFGLRVIDMHGLRLQFQQIALRNLLRPIDGLPVFYLVAAVAAMATRNSQRLGDLAGGTVVIYEQNPSMPDLEPIAPAKYNSLLAYPHLAGRLRSLVQPEAVFFALRAVTARDRFQASARIELFAELADYFRSLVRFPEEALEGLSDEQFVRSVLRTVFKPSPPVSRAN
jgi:uncharacterized RDD family membrane protein YckC